MARDSLETVKPTALLVSHGQPSEPDVAEVEIASFSDLVAPHLPDFRVEAVTLAKRGRLEEMVAAFETPPLVYPVFMTDGWFTQTALPKRFNGAPATFLRPLGTDLALVDLAVSWLAQELEDRQWYASGTKLIVLGHGSGRSDAPARDTRLFADRVMEKLPFADLRVGFVEEDPSLEDALGGAGGQAIALPFFATKRGHVLDDLPEAYEATAFSGLKLDPIGLHPGIPKMVAASLKAALADA